MARSTDSNTVNSIRELSQRGMTKYSIGDELGIAANWVAQIAKENNIPLLHGSNPNTLKNGTGEHSQLLNCSEGEIKNRIAEYCKSINKGNPVRLYKATKTEIEKLFENINPIDKHSEYEINCAVNDRYIRLDGYRKSIKAIRVG